MDVEVFSFFSGLGFLDLGFENAGFNIVFVNEHDNRFLSAYQYARRNGGHTPAYGYSEKDVREYLSDELWKKTFPDYDNREEKLIGFIGGPPCPDFSTAGKNRGENGENGQLTSVYVKLITKYKPDFFVLENVKGLVQTKKHKEFYERMKRKLYRAGYSLFDSFINNEFKLKPQYLLDEGSKEKYANKYFKDLDTETRKTFWNYQLMIIEIDSAATRDDIITMFNRLNLTDYKDFLFGLTDELEEAQSTLYEKMQATSTDNVEEDLKD